MNTTLRNRLLIGAGTLGLLVVVGYQASGYVIGLLYGGAMKAHQATQAREAQAPQPSSKPHGWSTDNVFLGRWQGLSTAGNAVIGVLDVQTNRISWGNAANGTCDSDYTVEHLPWGRNGTYPDQLVPPSEPTDVVVAVARLTLQPTPCSTGDAVIQLAIPLDGSRDLNVNTYDANGELIGSYGMFKPIDD